MVDKTDRTWSMYGRMRDSNNTSVRKLEGWRQWR